MARRKNTNGEKRHYKKFMIAIDAHSKNMITGEIAHFPMLLGYRPTTYAFTFTLYQNRAKKFKSINEAIQFFQDHWMEMRYMYMPFHPADGKVKEFTRNSDLFRDIVFDFESISIVDVEGSEGPVNIFKKEYGILDNWHKPFTPIDCYWAK